MTAPMSTLAGIDRELTRLEQVLTRLLPRPVTAAQRRVLAVVDAAPGGRAALSQTTDPARGEVSAIAAKTLVRQGHLELVSDWHFRYVRRPPV